MWIVQRLFPTQPLAVWGEKKTGNDAHKSHNEDLSALAMSSLSMAKREREVHWISGDNG